MSTVLPAMQSGGNTKATTSATGASYVAFGSQSCKQLVIVNSSGTDIDFKQDSAGDFVTVTNGTSFPIYGIHNTNQISVSRTDASNSQVVVRARWEA